MPVFATRFIDRIPPWRDNDANVLYYRKSELTFNVTYQALWDILPLWFLTILEMIDLLLLA